MKFISTSLFCILFFALCSCTVEINENSQDKHAARAARKEEKKAKKGKISPSNPQENTFKSQFPSLAALDSKLLKELGTPLAFPSDESTQFSHDLWFRCNPIYGALLWRKKIIDAWFFVFSRSLPLKNSIEFSYMSQLFSGVGTSEVIISKDCSKDNFGCLAGHLFLFQQKKIKSFEELLSLIKMNCKKEFDPQVLDLLVNYESKGNVPIKHFLPSLISAFVYAASKQFTDSEKAAEYLERYRYEFQKTIKSSFTLGSSNAQSLVDWDLDDDLHKGISWFKESFYAFCDFFISSQVPTEIEFIKNLTYNKVTWSNCCEMAFTNWIIGNAYNFETHKFDKITTSNEKLSQLLSQTNGLESLFDQVQISGIYQNLPFVIYKQIRIEDEIFSLKGMIPNCFVLVPHEFYLSLSAQEIAISSSKYLCKPILLQAPNWGKIHFIDQSSILNAFAFELCSYPVNLLILGNHLNLSFMGKNSISPQDIFQSALSNPNAIYEMLKKISFTHQIIKDSENTIIECSFGIYDLHFMHSFFHFTPSMALGNQGNHTKFKPVLLVEDDFLKAIFGKEEEFTDPFDKLIWSFLSKDFFFTEEIEDFLQIKLLDYFTKIGHPNVPDSIASFIIKNPSFLGTLPLKSPSTMNFFSLIVSDLQKEADSKIFSRLTCKFSGDESTLIQILLPILKFMTSSHDFYAYNCATKNEDLFKVYGALFYGGEEGNSQRVPRIIKDFILDHLATSNNQSASQREELMNFILEACSFIPNKEDDDDQGLFDQILGKFSFLNEEYLKGYSYSFQDYDDNHNVDDDDQSTSDCKIVSPTVYAAFALRFDLSFEFLRHTKTAFDHRFEGYFKGLKIDEKKILQLKQALGESEFLNEMALACK